MPLWRTRAAGKLLLRKSDQYRILSDAFDPIPWNDEIVTFSKPEKAVAPSDDQCQHALTFLVKLKITGIPQPCSVAEIDDLQTSQICRTVPLHKNILPPYLIASHYEYMRREFFYFRFFRLA